MRTAATDSGVGTRHLLRLAGLTLALLIGISGVLARPATTRANSGSQTFGYTGGLQTFTVPTGVTSLRIQAIGAEGGLYASAFPTPNSLGGHGASITGDFAVTAGQQLAVLVGGWPGGGGGGGGGSFVWRGDGFAALAANPTTALLLAAGGGGGASQRSRGMDASASNAGNTSGGNGGYGGTWNGGGGGGLTSAGGDGASNPAPVFPSYGAGGGQAIIAGAGGGHGLNDRGGGGGFGGGGGGGITVGASIGSGGGGGGFRGGDGGYYDGTGSTFGHGGGGGSYNGGANQVNTAGTGNVSGHGRVVIDWGPPTVSSPTATNVLDITAVLGGTVTYQGGGAVTERGVVYAPTSTNGDPQIGGTGATKAAATDGGTGSFTVNVTGLARSTGYSFRAYAVNSAGVSYSSVATFTTISGFPAVTSPTAGTVGETAATLGGTVTSEGTLSLSERGVVYALTSTNGDPQIGGAGVIKAVASPGGVGGFAVNVTGLTGSTDYSFRAYATNPNGTSYSAVAVFTSWAGATTRTPSAADTPQTFTYTNSLAILTVPAGVTSVTIRAVGAAGGGDQGGRGAAMQGDFAVTAGQQLTVLVGASGGNTDFLLRAGGGGGGSFVWKGAGWSAVQANPTAALLVAAGGGGGGCGGTRGLDATTASWSGRDGTGSGAGWGDNGSLGGAYGSLSSEPSGAGGGGGLAFDGYDGSGPESGRGGRALVHGGLGGYSSPDFGNRGGLGGGGGGGGAAGGGGGYRGGGGGGITEPSFCNGVGGGAASYNGGTNQANTEGVGTDNGQVTISWALPDTTAPVVTISSVFGSAGPDYTAPFTVTTRSTTDITWSAGEAGSYAIKLGGTGCGDATPVGGTGNSNTGGSYTSGSVTTTIAVANLGDDGSYVVRVCLADAAGNTGAASVTIVKDTVAPAPSTNLASTPTSPASNLGPRITGTAEAGSNVTLYTNSTCTSVLARTGTAAEFATPGLLVSVEPNSTTTFYATATDAAGNIGACSTSSVTYVVQVTVVLTVVKTANGGTVAVAVGATAVSPTGACDLSTASCAFSIAAGATATVTATAATGYTVGGWTGCAAVSGATCTVTLDAAKSVTVTFTPVTVTKTATTTTLTASANPSTVGQPVVFTATVSAVRGRPTGSVIFKDGETTLGSETLSDNGRATFRARALVAGSHTITAVYSGDPTFAGSTATPLTQVVTWPSTTYDVTVRNVGNGGGTVTSTPTGIDCSATCTAAFAAGAAVTLTAQPANGSAFAGWTGDCTGMGACMLTVDGGKRVTATFSRRVLAPTTTTLVSSANPSLVGQAVTFTATVNPSAATGSVTFMDGNTVLATVPLSGNTATFTTSALPRGTYRITAAYSGDSTYAGSTSAVVRQDVNRR